ncbi:MAG: pyridoxal-phosphate dependent enzyme [Bacteroidales bacterium]|jgi:threonine dehydratase|nr:pyridoxal-phosphate dependent enzyme [Bacteroidales bacterium]HOC49076.1 pyridoxal-phosphate dependent enzyme [Bacteroidales bacterium]
MLFIPAFKDIEAASRLISPHVHRTPVLTSKQLDAISGARLFFKCENFQKVGAFKFRGATNAVLNLTEGQRAAGVVTHSSGNHAAALAHAAVSRGVKAFIVMPSSAPEVKKRAVAGYGAEITFCEPTLAAREAAAAEVIGRTGATMIHPYDNFYIIAGQGTAAMELLEDIPDPDAVLAPVGGGGLLSGSAITIRHMAPPAKIYGAEPLLADDAARSLRTGAIQPALPPHTIADGLLTSLCERTFTVIKNNVDDILTVTEEQIIAAMTLMWTRMKIVVEPSSAVPLAAVLANRELFSGKKVAIIVSGGNADLSKLPFGQHG